MKGSGGWVGTKEAATRLGIVLRTLYRLINEGELPAYKMGRVLRIKSSDLDQYVEASAASGKVCAD